MSAVRNFRVHMPNVFAFSFLNKLRMLQFSSGNRVCSLGNLEDKKKEMGKLMQHGSWQFHTKAVFKKR